MISENENTPDLTTSQMSGTLDDRIEKPKIPDNYFIWAVLSTVLCCLPLGVVSLVYSSKVSTHYLNGEYQQAETASKNAKKWAVASAIAAGVVAVLYLLLIIGLAVSGELQY